MANDTHFVNSDTVIASDEPPEIIAVTIGAEGADHYRIGGGEIEGHVELIRADWHEALYAKAKWAMARLADDGRVVTHASGAIVMSGSHDDLLRACVDRMFGAGKWQQWTALGNRAIGAPILERTESNGD